MRTAVVAVGQSIYDIAIQHCGSVGAASTIAILNGMDVTSIPVAGTSLWLPDVVNNGVVRYYSNNNLTPATVWQEV